MTTEATMAPLFAEAGELLISDLGTGTIAEL